MQDTAPITTDATSRDEAEIAGFAVQADSLEGAQGRTGFALVPVQDQL